MRRIGDVVWLLWLAALLCLPLDTAQAQTRKRVALLIGNGDYASATTLDNPRNDVRLVAEAAGKAGFQTVTIKQDLGIGPFQQALREFRALADGAQVAMVYYAGHGMEGNGRNWLIPTDAALANDRDLPYEAINLDQVMEAIEGATLRMVVLDACRNNPFGRSWRGGTRAVSRGLGSVDADDVLVIYAAAPGQLAADGEGGNSPFAAALAGRLAEPGLPVQMLGGAVRDDVLAATGGNQRPFVSASITGKAFYLVQANADAGGAMAIAANPAPLVDAQPLDLATWQGAIAANSATAFEDYLRSHPQGRFRVQAEQNLARLSASIGAAAPAATPLDTLRKLALGRWRTKNGRGFGVIYNCVRYIEILEVNDQTASFKSYDNPSSTGQPLAWEVTEVLGNKLVVKAGMSWLFGTFPIKFENNVMSLGTCDYFRAPVGGPEPPIVR